jgi:hypothetical protein
MLAEFIINRLAVNPVILYIFAFAENDDSVFLSISDINLALIREYAPRLVQTVGNPPLVQKPAHYSFARIVRVKHDYPVISRVSYI